MITVVGKMERAARKRQIESVKVAVHEDPAEELRRLVRLHSMHTKRAVALGNMWRHKKDKATGKIVKNELAEEVRAAFSVAEKAARDYASSLESAMTLQLRRLPIYKVFLSKVYGIGDGPIAAYLCAEIDIHKAMKPSQLTRYCGFAVINGRLERRSADANPHDVQRYLDEGLDLRSATSMAKKSKFNATMRTRIFQAFQSMWKNRAKKTAARPNGTTSKYLDIWHDVKHREESSERVNIAAGTWVDVNGKTQKGARKHCHSKGWHKAADIFLQDLYMVWRAVEGLPVWCGYYEAKLGVSHGYLERRPGQNVPQSMTVEEALSIVGDVSARPASVPVEDDSGPEPPPDTDEDMLDDDIGTGALAAE